MAKASMKYSSILLFMLCALLAAAQEGEIVFAVHKAPEYSIYPDVKTIFNDTAYSLVLIGPKEAHISKVRLSKGWVETQNDSSIFIHTTIPPHNGVGFDTSTSLLSITIKNPGRADTVIQRQLLVMVRKRPVPSTTRTTNRVLPPGTYLSNYSYEWFRMRKPRNNGTIAKDLAVDNDKEIRKYIGMRFEYVDSTTRNNYAGFRRIELFITERGVDQTYVSNGSYISLAMSRAIKAQKGKGSYTFVLHKKYIRGDATRRDITETISYQRPVKRKSDEKTAKE